MNRINLAGCVVVIAAAIGLAGCDSGGDAGGSDMDAMAAQLEQNKQAEADAAAAEQAKVEAEKKAAEEAAAKQAAIDATQAQQAAAESAAPAMGETATVGKLQRRNTVDGPLRYYGAISNARIVFEDRALGWQIQKSMDVYVNTHDGKYPQSTEEYMREIIEANMIELPELQPGQEFFYDPEDHELKIGELIEQPAEATPPPQ